MAYKNIWFYISSKGYISLKGYGVFVNHPGKISLEIQSERTARVNISVPGEEVEYIVVYNQTVLSPFLTHPLAFEAIHRSYSFKSC